MPEITKYRLSDGKILMWVAAPGSGEDQCEEGEGFLEGRHSSDTHYVVDGAPVERPENPAVLDKSAIVADGVDLATISGIPVGSRVIVWETGESWIVDDGALELTVDEPGAYRVSIDCHPYLPKELTVNAS